MMLPDDFIGTENFFSTTTTLMNMYIYRVSGNYNSMTYFHFQSVTSSHNIYVRPTFNTKHVRALCYFKFFSCQDH